MIYPTTNNICWHERMQKTVGPTTDQINWYCPDCGASRVTFPTAEERLAAVSKAIEQAKAAPVELPVVGEVERGHYGGRTRNIGFLRVVLYDKASVMAGDKLVKLSDAQAAIAAGRNAS